MAISDGGGLVQAQSFTGLFCTLDPINPVLQKQAAGLNRRANKLPQRQMTTTHEYIV